MASAALAHSVNGPEEGPPIVLLHGFPLNRSMWSPQAKAFVQRGYRVVTPDLPGLGESPGDGRPTTMRRIAEEVFALVETLRLSRFALAGFSLGGYVALEAVALHPDRVGALLLVDTRAEPESKEGRESRLALAERVRREGVGVLEQAMLPKLLTERTRAKQPDLVERVRAMIRGTRPEDAANVLLGMADRPDQRPQLPRIKVPTLIVVGAEDQLTPPASSIAMRSAIPHAQLRILSGCAHLSNLEAPEAFNHVVGDWLTANAPAGLTRLGA